MILVGVGTGVLVSVGDGTVIVGVEVACAGELFSAHPLRRRENRVTRTRNILILFKCMLGSLSALVAAWIVSLPSRQGA